MLQKMITLQKLPDEEAAVYMARLRRKIKHLKEMHSFRDGDHTAHLIMFKWAGHVARMAQYSCERLTYRVLQHKCWDWICKVAAPNKGSQLHGRRLKVWRWERPVYKFFKQHVWQEAAQNKESWYEQLENMTDWRGRQR